jgi:plastocyanin
MSRGKRIVVAVIAFLVVASPAAAIEQRVEPSGATTIERVRIVDFRFRPRSLTIERGTVVRWRNRGERNHTTTSDTNRWDSGILAPGESFRRRFRRAGTFAYHCDIHPQMTATITVT